MRPVEKRGGGSLKICYSVLRSPRKRPGLGGGRVKRGGEKGDHCHSLVSIPMEKRRFRFEKGGGKVVSSLLHSSS